MRILSIDPGPDMSAWVCMENGDIHTARVGMISSTTELISSLVRSHLDVDVLAVESVADYINPKKSAKTVFNLFKTCRVVGMFEMLAHEHSIPFFTAPANSPSRRDSWRSALVGRTSYQPGDADVQRTLKLLFPTHTDWWNVHIRDAVGLNLYALSQVRRIKALQKSEVHTV